MSKIIAAWESPTNEGTEKFEVGEVWSPWIQYQGRDDKNIRSFTVGSIERETWEDFADGLFDLSMRVEIYDTDDKLRVSLPASACAVEYEP